MHRAAPQLPDNFFLISVLLDGRLDHYKGVAEKALCAKLLQVIVSAMREHELKARVCCESWQGSRELTSLAKMQDPSLITLKPQSPRLVTCIPRQISHRTQWTQEKGAGTCSPTRSMHGWGLSTRLGAGHVVRAHLQDVLLLQKCNDSSA